MIYEKNIMIPRPCVNFIIFKCNYLTAINLKFICTYIKPYNVYMYLIIYTSVILTLTLKPLKANENIGSPDLCVPFLSKMLKLNNLLIFGN